ncbi:SAM-dependent methyltransferase [Rhizobium sp. SORGH_AS 787]|nr:SAM-dependent methyltransferase [Rhizobium sp. SORGH_AS_0787]
MVARNNRIVLDGQSLVTPDSVSNELLTQNDSNSQRDLAVAEAEVALILNLAHQQFIANAAPATIIHSVAGRLHQMRRKYDYSVWIGVLPLIQQHPVADYFLEDPFTKWSFEKPRGYSGDAQLLDFIYGHASVADRIQAASPLGTALYDYTREASSSVAVRERRDILTRYVDDIAQEKGPETEILTIAAGHLREANRSQALASNGIKRWVALDQDPLSIGSIARDFAGTSVEAVDGSVKDLLARSHDLGQFDFVYAAGLYDYLTDKVAIKLTRRCLDMLKPGGTFLFANFAEDIAVDGYMESFMNWTLLLRSKADMWKIINASIAPSLAESEVFHGQNHNIVYGVIRKL